MNINMLTQEKEGKKIEKRKDSKWACDINAYIYNSLLYLLLTLNQESITDEKET